MTRTLEEINWLEKYKSLVAGMREWRIESSRSQAKKILPFVRGLRFATLLINSFQEFLPEGLYADWGQIYDQGRRLSRECDILIYRGRPAFTWNGSRKQIMRYVFVQPDQVRVVISCKQWFKGITNDIRKYCDDLKPFVKKIWLFAECCWAKDDKRVGVIRSQVEECGYDRFCYLYRLYESQDLEPKDNYWIDFVKTLQRL